MANKKLLLPFLSKLLKRAATLCISSFYMDTKKFRAAVQPHVHHISRFNQVLHQLYNGQYSRILHSFLGSYGAVNNEVTGRTYFKMSQMSITEFKPQPFKKNSEDVTENVS